jgi:hypothetical protein
MATLAGQRAQFTWALNQYNLAEDPETRTHFAKRMAKYIAAAPSNNFAADQITRDKTTQPRKSLNISTIRVSRRSRTFRKTKQSG